MAIVEGGPTSSITLMTATNSQLHPFTKAGVISIPEIGADPTFSPKYVKQYHTPFDLQYNNRHCLNSCRGSYLITWSLYRSPKPSSKDPTSLIHNLRIWHVRNNNERPTKGFDGKNMKSCSDSIPAMPSLLTSFSLKVFKPDTVQFSMEEKFLFHCVSNEIHIYQLPVLEKPVLVSKIVHKYLSQFAVSPTLSVTSSEGVVSWYINVAVFVPEIGGRPATTTLYRYMCDDDFRESNPSTEKEPGNS